MAPEATVTGVQRLGKVQSFIIGGKAIFYKSISNDHKPPKALMLYYRHIKTNMRRQEKKKKINRLVLFTVMCCGGG